MKQNITREKCPDCSIGNEEYCVINHDPVKGMKQNITSSQLNELSDKGKEKLSKWWKPRQGDKVYDRELKGGPKWIASLSSAQQNEKYLMPLLSIGQMVEFLEAYYSKQSSYFDIEKEVDGDWSITYGKPIKLNKGGVTGHEFGDYYDKELSDALWEATKEVLDGR